MREGWSYKKLGELATFINGYPFKPSDWKDCGRRIIRIQNLNNPKALYNYYDGDIDAKYLVSNGDVLISWSGSLGVFEWSEDEAILNQHIFKVVFNKGDINKRFFEYVVSSRINEMKTKVHGITMQHITKRDFDVIPIPIPPLSEQQRIVNELDLLSSIIEKKKAQLKEYDQLAQSIFYDMFGDPIENPKDWEMNTVGELSLEMRYGTSRPACEDGKYNYLRMGNLTNEGYLNLDDLKKINIPDNEIEKCIVRRGDVLFNRTNSLELIGKTCLFDLEEPMVIAGYLIRVRFKESILPLYFTRLFNLSEIKKKLRSMAKGAVHQANINAKELASIIIPIPPLTFQQSFASKIEAIERQKALVQQSITEAGTLFNSRMDYYFN